MMHSSRGGLVALSLLLSAGVGLAACGDSADDDGTAAATTSTGGDGVGGGTGATGAFGGAGATGADGGSGGAGGGPPLGTCGEVAGAICAKFQECLPFVLATLYPDVATCVAKQTQLCENNVDAPGNGFQEDDFSSCSAALGATSCDEFFSGELTGCTAEPGTLQDGTACGADSQCQSSQCDIPADEICGACAPVVAEGGSCSGQNVECEGGTVCDATTNTCVKPKKTDEVCGPGAPCVLGLACQNGQCKKAGQANDPCSMGSPCDFLGGFQCVSGTCEPIPLADIGDACGFSMGASTFCKGGASCVSDVCVGQIADGQGCSAGPNEVGCQDPAECVGGTCTFPDANTCM